MRRGRAERVPPRCNGVAYFFGEATACVSPIPPNALRTTTRGGARQTHENRQETRCRTKQLSEVVIRLRLLC